MMRAGFVMMVLESKYQDSGIFSTDINQLCVFSKLLTPYIKFKCDSYTMRRFASCFKGLIIGATLSTSFYCLQERATLWPVGWGANRYGELGIGSNINSTVPTRLFQQFRDISAKKSVSAAIGADGRVYVWGKVWKGLLAEGINTNCLLPTEIESLPLGRYKQV